MTNKEILQADLLDNLFENRNKAYGAYALRKNYNHRLQWALGISLSLVLLLLMIDLQKKDSGDATYSYKPDVTLSTVDIPKPKTPESPQPRRQPEVAQIKSTQIKIVSNDEVKRPEVPTITDLQDALPSTITKNGVSPDSSKGTLNVSIEKVNDGRTSNDKDDFGPKSSGAQFPGGKEAFAKFLRRYLVTPDELGAGEKKVVLVRFMVDGDGSISKTEIVQSGGDLFDREVIRVLNKMPKWIPAMQNGTKVTTWFTQPVSFIGIE
jgi:protein TonB